MPANGCTLTFMHVFFAYRTNRVDLNRGRCSSTSTEQRKERKEYDRGRAGAIACLLACFVQPRSIPCVCGRLCFLPLACLLSVSHSSVSHPKLVILPTLFQSQFDQPKHKQTDRHTHTHTSSLSATAPSATQRYCVPFCPDPSIHRLIDSMCLDRSTRSIPPTPHDHHPLKKLGCEPLGGSQDRAVCCLLLLSQRDGILPSELGVTCLTEQPGRTWLSSNPDLDCSAVFHPF